MTCTCHMTVTQAHQEREAELLGRVREVESELVRREEEVGRLQLRHEEELRERDRQAARWPGWTLTLNTVDLF